jgi:hypothetical protein
VYLTTGRRSYHVQMSGETLGDAGIESQCVTQGSATGGPAVPAPVSIWAACNRKIPDFMVALLMSCVSTTVIWLGTDKLRMTDPAFHNVGDDHVYLFMASHKLGYFHIAPFSWRILVPELVHVLPFQPETAFEIIALTATMVTGAAVFMILRQWRFTRSYAIAGLLLFFSMSYATRFTLRDFWLTDSSAFCFVSLGILALQRHRKLTFSACMLVGVLAKESVLFIAPLYYTFEARQKWDRRVSVQTVILAAPAVAALVSLRFVIPAWNGQSNYLATLPKLVQLDVSNLASYNPRAVIRATIAARIPVWWTTADYTVTSFGLLPIVLSVLGWRHLRPVLRRFWPFLMLVSAQLFFALNTQRLIVLAFIPVIICCLYGAQQISYRYKMRSGWLIAAAIVGIGLELSSRKASSPVPFLQIGALVSVACIIALTVSLRNRFNNGAAADDTAVLARFPHARS